MVRHARAAHAPTAEDQENQHAQIDEEEHEERSRRDDDEAKCMSRRELERGRWLLVDRRPGQPELQRRCQLR